MEEDTLEGNRFLANLDFEQILAGVSANITVPEKFGAVQRPLFEGTIDEVVEVAMREQAVTKATDDKPVLATYGIGPCIALVGYDPVNKIGFLTHYTNATELKHSFTSLLCALNRAGCNYGFDVRIVCNDSFSSEKEIDLLRNLVEHRNLHGMRMVEEDLEPSGEISKSIALDTRTGEVFSYNPLEDPDREPYAELDGLRMLAPGSARMVYMCGEEDLFCFETIGRERPLFNGPSFSGNFSKIIEKEISEF